MIDWDYLIINNSNMSGSFKLYTLFAFIVAA